MGRDAIRRLLLGRRFVWIGEEMKIITVLFPISISECRGCQTHFAPPVDEPPPLKINYIQYIIFFAKKSCQATLNWAD
jgi:hypothetical protein